MRAPEMVGVERFIEFFERAVVRGALNLAGGDSDIAAIDGGEHHVFGVHKKQALLNFDEDFEARGNVALSGVAKLVDKLLETVGSGRLRVERFARALDGFGDACLVEGLEDVIDGVYVEGLNGVLIERGSKNDMWHFHFAFDKLFEDTEAVKTGHLNVKEDQIGGVFFDERDGFDAVFALADDVDFGKSFEKKRELFARGFFVVNDDGVDGHRAVVMRQTANAVVLVWMRRMEPRPHDFMLGAGCKPANTPYSV